MQSIQSIGIVGMGALGMLFGEQLMNSYGRDRVSFLMERERIERHSRDSYSVNGKRIDFQLRDIEEAVPVDLLIIAVKYHAFQTVIEQIRPVVGRETIIISLLNGISSEEMLAEKYQRNHIIACVAIGMDAMRNGTELNFINRGRLQIGITGKEQEKSFRLLTECLQKAGIPFETEEDIRHAMWKKFMLNVGANQACTVYETDYQGILNFGPIREEMIEAMREVIAVASVENVLLTEADLEERIHVLETLNPSGYPSMRQDMVSGRPTEVQIFAGAVTALGEKHHIPTPVNQKYERIIRRMEEGFS